MNAQIVGENVRRLREERGWMAFQLALYADLTPACVSQIETGKRAASLGSLIKLARALKVEPGVLFEGVS